MKGPRSPARALSPLWVAKALFVWGDNLAGPSYNKRNKMIPEKYLPLLVHMRGVTSDENGEKVLVGLTATETTEFFHHIENPDPDNKEATDRYFELHERYAAARLHDDSRLKTSWKSRDHRSIETGQRIAKEPEDAAKAEADIKPQIPFELHGL